jgi:hypothetical protein
MYTVLRMVVDEPSRERRALLVEQVTTILPAPLKARVLRVAADRIRAGRLVHVAALGGCLDEGCH